MVIEDALKNLYKVYYLGNNIKQRDNTFSQMRKHISDEIEEIVNKLNVECDKDLDKINFV